MKILVVEDSKIDHLFVQTILEKHHHEIHVATNGLDALVQVAAVMPDVILLDAMMPEMDGYEVCRFITHNPETKDIPVIFLTSLETIEDLVRAFDAGAVDFVRKPPNELELIARIHSAYRIKRYQDSLKARIIKDGLTGLYTRSYLVSVLEREFHSVKRYQGTLGLVLFDIDDFKKVNDTYGHLAGDRTLVMVSKILRAEIRNTDIPARYGGEEFALVMTHTGLKETQKAAERIRKKVDQAVMKGTLQDISVTVSAGLTMCSAADSDYNDMIRRADEALYEAKKGGKNRVVVSA